MRMWGTRKQRLASSVALAALVLVLPACGGGNNGGGTTTVTASFVSNDASAAADLVRFSGSSCTGDNCTLTVSIGGPTTSSDYYAFAFDIQISDPTVAQFTTGSDAAGAFLTGTVDSVVSQNADRVVVGVSKQGPVAGNGTAAEASVLTLNFRLLKVGSANLTFVGSPSNPNLPNCGTSTPEALDSNGDCIASTTFGAGGTISGS